MCCCRNVGRLCRGRLVFGVFSYESFWDEFHLLINIIRSFSSKSKHGIRRGTMFRRCCVLIFQTQFGEGRNSVFWSCFVRLWSYENWEILHTFERPWRVTWAFVRAACYFSLQCERRSLRSLWGCVEYLLYASCKVWSCLSLNAMHDILCLSSRFLKQLKTLGLFAKEKEDSCLFISFGNFGLLHFGKDYCLANFISVTRCFKIGTSRFSWMNFFVMIRRIPEIRDLRIPSVVLFENV